MIKHSLKDTISNLKSRIKANLWSNVYNGGDRILAPPSDYKLVFEDNFDNPLNLQEWRYGQPWGDFHADVLCQYYGKGDLAYVSTEGLALELRNIPKTYKKSELPLWRQKDHLPEEFTIPVGVGMVSTKQSWKYGWFEAEIKLPKGTPYWAAFWLSGAETWPPEIDIFEAYSDEGDVYSKKNIFGKFTQNKKIQPNLHYGNVNEGSKTMYGSYSVSVADCTERYVQYACLWEEDRIEIYYDGIRVFKCTDPEILKWYNAENSNQFVILNHGYYHYADLEKDIPRESAVLVKSFRVLQKNNVTTV